MSADVSCFDDIIGLSRTPCSDYDLSTDITTSDSGLYLDELLPLHKWESVLNCKEGENVFTFMERARDNAIIDFRIDATAMLTKYNKLVRNPFSGRIGKVKRSSALTTLTSGKYYGIVLNCDDIVSGVAEITNIGVMFDSADTFNVYIYNNLNELVDTVSVTSVADALAENTCSVDLPLHSDYVENLQYFIVFQYDGSNSPYNNEFYDTQNRPVRVKKTQGGAQFGFSDYMDVSGTSLTSVSDLSDVLVSTESRCFGLTLAINMKCQVEQIWCLSEMDYVGNAVDMAIAKAVRLKAGSNLIRDIALTENLNRDSMIDGVTLGEIDEAFIGEYTEIIEFIVDNIDITKTDCFECGREILGGVMPIYS